MNIMKLILLGLSLTTSVAYANSKEDNESEIKMYELPDPAAATTFSFLGGYGIGHFYARQPEAGVIFATTQIASLAAMYGGINTIIDGNRIMILYGSNAHNRGVAQNKINDGKALLIVGASAFVVSRIIDIATASSSAHSTAKKMMGSKISPIASVTDHRNFNILTSRAELVLDQISKDTSIEPDLDDYSRSIVAIKSLLESGVSHVSICDTISKERKEADVAIYDILFRTYNL